MFLNFKYFSVKMGHQNGFGSKFNPFQREQTKQYRNNK